MAGNEIRTEPSLPFPPQRERPMLVAEGLHKSFGRRQVLRGVSLEVLSGQVISIIGPNGSGKSTFLRCLNLLEQYQQGRVFLDGQEVSSGKPQNHHPGRAERAAARRLRCRMGMVFQHFNLFPHMTVMQNVSAGPLHVLKMPPREAAAVAEAALRKVGLWEKHPCDPATLSGGQKQRAAIARALAMNPEILLLDEATSALDPVMTKEVFRVVRQLAAEGMTMLLVTHDLDFARAISDRVVFMDAGLIAAQGEPDYIFGQRPTESIRQFLSAAD
ncbi:MAG: amino acid ABC transporter ATP-binding protein [Planctomycetes bacterium]|nr:amino acid ABC transporter ATP-binding protein [Planctomycetota bacterium]